MYQTFPPTKRFVATKGADLASANTLTLAAGNSFDVTGTTQINQITTGGRYVGEVIVLQFDAALTVSNNAIVPPAGTAAILLAGAANLSATAGDTLTLWYDGTVWRELARAVI